MVTPKPQQFPHQPRPPVKRLPRREYVTIAVGFYRVTGLVLCADTQETLSGFKRNVPKIEIRPHTFSKGTACAVFAGAGDGSLIDHVIDKLWGKMAANADTLEKMIQAAEQELIRLYKSLVPCYHAGFMPDAQLLVGIYCPPNWLEMVEIIGPVLTRTIKAKSIGCGESLSSYIEERLINPKGELSDVIPAAIYIVDEAKKHVDGCGGETHVVTMTDDGNVERLHQFHVEPKSKAIEEIDSFARMIAVNALNETIPDDSVRHSINSLVDEMISARQKLKNPQG